MLGNIIPRASKAWLQISAPRDFYIPGDTISGDLCLRLSDQSVVITKATVQLICNEICDSDNTGEPIHRPTQTIEIDLTLYPQDKKLKRKYPFSFTIGSSSNGLPPSLSLCKMGEYNAGVFWTLDALVDTYKTVGSNTDYQAVEGYWPLEFYPIVLNDMPLAHELAPLQCATPLVSTFTLGDCKVTLRNPWKLPQAPEKFSLEILLEPLKSTNVSSVSVFLVKRVTVIDNGESRLLESSIRLGKVKFNKPLEDRTRRGTVLDDCQLEERQPQAFMSYAFAVQYMYRIKMVGDKTRYQIVHPVHVYSPSFQRGLERILANGDPLSS